MYAGQRALPMAATPPRTQRAHAAAAVTPDGRSTQPALPGDVAASPARSAAGGGGGGGGGGGHGTVWQARAAVAAFVPPADRLAGAAATLRALPPARRSDAAAEVLRLARSLQSLAELEHPAPTAAARAAHLAPAADLLEFVCELDAWRSGATLAAALGFGALLLNVGGHDLYALKRLDELFAIRTEGQQAAEWKKRVETECLEPLKVRAGSPAKDGGAGIKKNLLENTKTRRSLTLDSPQKGYVRYKTKSVDAVIRDMAPASEVRRSLTSLRGADVFDSAITGAGSTDDALSAALCLSDVDVFARVGSQNMKLHYAREGSWPHKLHWLECLARARGWTVVCAQEVHSKLSNLAPHFEPLPDMLETTGCPWLSGSARSPWVHCHVAVCDGLGGIGCGGKAEGASFFYDSTAWTRLVHEHNDGAGNDGSAAALRPLRYENRAGCVGLPPARVTAAAAVVEASAPKGEAGDVRDTDPTAQSSRFKRTPALIVLRSTESRGPPGVLAVVSVHLRSNDGSGISVDATAAEVRALGAVAAWATASARSLALEGERVATLFIGDFNLRSTHPAFSSAHTGLRHPPALGGGVSTNLAHLVGAARAGTGRIGQEFDNAWLAEAAHTSGGSHAGRGHGGNDWMGDPLGAVALDKDVKAFVAARDLLQAAAARAQHTAEVLGSDRVVDLVRGIQDHLEKYAGGIAVMHSDHLAIEATLVLRGDSVPPSI